MPRSYHFCPMCRRRMRLIGISPETFSQPPLPVERYYQCPNCEAEYTYNLTIPISEFDLCSCGFLGYPL